MQLTSVDSVVGVMTFILTAANMVYKMTQTTDKGCHHIKRGVMEQRNSLY